MKTTKRDSRFWVKRILLPLANGPNDFFRIDLDGRDPQILAREYSKALYKKRRDWDEMRLFLVGPGSDLIKSFCEELQSLGMKARLFEKGKNFFIRTNEDWNSYYEFFLRKSLRDVRGRINRISKAGHRYEIIQTKNIEKKELDHILDLYFERRKLLDQRNSFANTTHRKMLYEVLGEYQKKGWLLLSKMVNQDGKIWAYQLDFYKEGIEYHYVPVFDPEFKEFSPGKVLLFETLKLAFENPCISEFNFMRGESEYKTQYSRDYSYYQNLFVTNPWSWRNWISMKRDKYFRPGKI
jgi:Acetyltransferase (GNAT) domain